MRAEGSGGTCSRKAERSAGVLLRADIQGIALQDAALKGAEPVEPFAQTHDIADDDDSGRLEIGSGDILRRATKRCFQHRLILQRGIAHERDGFIRAAAVFDQQR